MEGQALLGRADECRRLTALLDAARAGTTGVVVLRGEPGIGKTTLLEYAAGRADGMTVLRARGVAFESELAFSGLYELVRPVLGYLDELPPVQADALRVAFALSGDGTVNRLAVYGATLGLLAAAADTTPVLCLIDDAHWLDPASAEALLFAARRMLVDPVAVVFAARDSPGFAAPGLTDLVLSGLGPAAGARLATRSGMAPRAAAELVAATAGNPLALVELPATLTEAQRRGRAPLDQPLPTAGRVEAAFLAQARSLAEDTWQALVTCAACDTGEMAVLARALRVDGLELAALDPAVAAGLITVRAGVVTFRHPLVRSAVYSAAGPGQRQSAHLAAAGALTGSEDADRRAWHLAAAAPAPDEQVAAALAETAERALRRGGVVAKARAYERAARLSPDPEVAAQRLFEAGSAWLNAGVSEHAAALLDEVATSTGRPNLKCQTESIRAYLALQRGETRAVGAAFIAQAESYASTDPYAAGEMMSSAVNHFWARLDIAGMLRLCQRVTELTTPDPWDQQVYPKGLIRLASAQVLAGLPEGSELARSCVVNCRYHPDGGTRAELAEVLIWIGDHDTARDLLTADVDQAGQGNNVFLLGYALTRLALLETRSGRLHVAHRAAGEAVQIAEQVGQRSQQAQALARLCLVEALRGAEERCRELAERASQASPDGFLDVAAQIRYALGVCAMSAGRFAEAVPDLEWVDEVLRQGGVVESGMLPAVADLAECLARTGPPERAAVAIGALAAVATRTGRAAAGSALARCRGLVAAEDALDETFGVALELSLATGEPLEQARTLLCYGQRLRRAKRRRDAREHLYTALALFQEAGAAGWARQCQTEIDATGPHAAARDDASAEQLTGQEWQIALTAAEGLTNREIAARVFLSPKTVDYHLGHIYRKLGLRSRHELIRHLSHARPEPDRATRPDRAT